MNVLVTGATGFLGKQVIELLINDSKITMIRVLSRARATHPNPRVRVIRGDLSQSATLATLESKPDVVIHLAGLYRLGASYGELYLNNVAAAANLLGWLNRSGATNTRILSASSYSVLLGDWKHESESAVDELPPKSNPYAYTKAMVEKTLAQWSGPVSQFRLGILVGSSRTGEIEKIDGPYYLLRCFRNLQAVRLLNRFPVFLPGEPNSLLPLVPVDVAAKVFHEAIFRSVDGLFGVYRNDSVNIEPFIQDVLRVYRFCGKVSYIGRFPPVILAAQKNVTGIPSNLFDFAYGVTLENSNFQKHFSDIVVPMFADYRDAFFTGFENFMKGGEA